MHGTSMRPKLRPNLRAALAGSLVAAVAAVAGAGLWASERHSPTAALESSTLNRATPRSFTGYGFDQCLAPTQASMDAWLASSPYWAAGIYIAGDSRACRKQPNLTPTWISTQLANGWRLLPITLGPQAYCNPRFPRYSDDVLIKRSSTDAYAAARTQGKHEAGTTVSAAAALGIATTSTLWYDIEAFDITNSGCRKSALAFLSGWTDGLRVLGYVSGVYSSGASGIKAIDDARINDPTFSEPDMLWIADWNGDPVVTSRWVRADGWMPGRRVHQYRGGHNATYGGATINIDSSFLDVGRGSVPWSTPPHCDGVPVDFPTYHRLTRESDAPLRTAAAECLLKEHGYFGGTPDGTFTRTTERAVSAFRVAVGLSTSPELGPRVWTALLSAGTMPLMKYGSASDAVRRLQRALNAAGDPQLPITGTFASMTTLAVKDYQALVGASPTGVVTAELWAQLQAGRR